VKIGIALYPAPPHMAPDDRPGFWIEEAARLGVQVVNGEYRMVFGWDPRQLNLESMRRLRARADELAVEIEPYAGPFFGLVGPGAAEQRAMALASMRAATILGGPYVRTGYGQLTLATSRFSPEVPLDEHLRRLVASLREAARMAEDAGVVLAVENHADFSGRELASVIAEVDSPVVRAAFDTGNSIYVFSDPLDDLAALAPVTVMVHLKDLGVAQNDVPGRLPFVAVGCALGQGMVDVPTVVRTLWEHGPRGRDLPLMIETSPASTVPGEDALAVRRRMFTDSIAYLRSLVADLERDAARPT
jgi:sugar phosphate isomerase/epimerase